MKYLNTNKAISTLLDELEVFFTFSEKQFDEQKREGVEYVSLGAGYICPKENVEKYIKGLKRIKNQRIQADLKYNGKKGVILRELGNYEDYITYSIDDTLNALAGYGITSEKVQAKVNDYVKGREND